MHELLILRGQGAHQVGLPGLHPLAGQDTECLGRAVLDVQRAGQCLLRTARLLQEQLIAALGLADIVRHQRQMGGQGTCEIEQVFRIALHQFELHFRNRENTITRRHVAGIDHDPEGDFPGNVDTPGSPLERGGEYRHQARLPLIEKSPHLAGIDGAEVESPGVGGFPLRAGGQPGHRLGGTFDRLQQFRRGLAHPQRDALLVQRQVRGVVIGIFQALGRAGFDTRGDQGMYPDAANVVGSAVELQFDFGSHGAAREMRMPPSLSKPPFRLYLAAAYFLPLPTVIDGKARGCKRRLVTAESGQ